MSPTFDLPYDYQSRTLRVGLLARNHMIQHAFHKKKHSVKRISKDFDLSIRHIQVYILGHNRPPKYRKLTDWQKQELIRMWEAKVPTKSIAATLKVDYRSVTKWKKRFLLDPRPRGRPRKRRSK